MRRASMNVKLGSVELINPADGQTAPRLGADSISVRQNSRWSITLLAAQRQRYIEAKRCRSVRSWSVAMAATVGLGTVVFAPGLLVVVGPLGALVAVVQWLAGLMERHHIHTAANIQEQFDISVFPLEWNPVLGEMVDPEDVAAAAGRFRGDPAPLADWYAMPDGLGRPFDVLICQRSNLRWDSTLRDAYSNTILAGLAALFLVTVGTGVAQGLSLGESILALLPSVGVVLLGADTARNHRRHAAFQHELKRLVEAGWSDAIQRPRKVQDKRLRSIQDRIHHLRTAAPLVPEWFYWWHRDDYERQMRLAVDRMAQEAEAATGRSPGVSLRNVEAGSKRRRGQGESSQP